ncbi:MAG: hypothetical protein ABFD83_10165 [Armatimonadota bacterium]
MKQNSRVIVDIDVNDEVIIRPEPMTESEVKTLLTNLKENGCDTILVRMGCLGLLPYRTSLTYPMAFDSQYAREWGKDQPFISDLEKIIERNESWLERYAKVIEAYNPPEFFLKYGHELGLKVIFWIDLYDDGFPGFRSKFIDENPWCQWTAKDGKTYFKGLISYAWPEAREFRLKQANELLDLGADGIHCSTSAHSRHMLNVHEVDYYGYEQPVADEYLKRYGVDIRTADDFDREAWHDIKGEMMDKLYSDLAELCHGRGKEFWIGMQLGKYTHMCADPYNGGNAVVRYANHWKYLVDKGIADAFIIGDYEVVSFNKGDEYWQAKPDIVPDEGDDLFDWIAKEYKNYCNSKTMLYLFGEWLSHDPKELDNQLSVWAQRVTKHGFDGIDVHEALNVEEPEHLAAFKRFANKLA